MFLETSRLCIGPPDRVLLNIFLFAITSAAVGCGFDFDRTFDDSDAGSDSDTIPSTDADTDSDTGTDEDSDTTPEPEPDFSLTGFALVNGETVGGGENATIVEPEDATSLAEYLSSETPYIIRLSSVIALEDEALDVAPDKTLEGLGKNGGITGHGLRLKGVENIIIRNLTFSDITDDALSIEDESSHVWVDHNDFSNTTDGLVDIKTGSSYITISWNHFHDQNKVSLIGASDDTGDTDRGNLKVTLHHNWFDRTEEQHPRCRFGEIHVFNNFYDNIDGDGYGIASTTEASVLSEANSFLNTDRPFSIQEGDSPQGALDSVDDLFENCGDPVEDGTVFEPTSYYSYKADAAKWISSMVQKYSGVGVIDVTEQ